MEITYTSITEKHSYTVQMPKVTPLQKFGYYGTDGIE